jgi:phosphate ABC transporter permease subunit PstA/phosphate ABC transporter permease protein PstC
MSGAESNQGRPTATKPAPRRGGTSPSGLVGGSGTRRGDAVFGGLVSASAWFLLLLMGAIAAFLVFRAVGALGANHANVVTYTGTWDPDGQGHPKADGSPGPAMFGIGTLAWGTLITSLFAILFAGPVAVGVALFITQYAPRRLAQLLGLLVDLLAAVPSIVYGLWGFLFLVPHMTGASEFVSRFLGWIPFFESNGAFGRSVFSAGVVLAIMILPIIAAISREVFLQTPSDQVEAAYALGATRWEMVKLAVLPYGRSGVGSAIVLGFGRALGETIAVAMILSSTFGFTTRFLQPGGNTIAANIANTFGSALKNGQGALIASGLVLFIVTFGVNLLARRITSRGVAGGRERRSFAALFTVRRPGGGAMAYQPAAGEPASGADAGRAVNSTAGRTVGFDAFVPAAQASANGSTTGAAPGSVRRRSADNAAHRASRSGAVPGVLSGISTARRIRSGFAGGLTLGAFALAILPLFSILWLVVSKGAGRLDSTFLNSSMRNVSEADPGGGAYHAVLGTLEQAGLATAMAVPLGILVAVYLVEYGRGPLAKAVTFFVDVMMGLPSIVAGLFILSMWILGLGFEKNGFAGSLALLILMLPLVIRSAEEMLKLVPDSLREASYALGIPKWRTIVKIVIPTALPGIITGIMLGVARVMGETAPILLVVNYATSINPDPFHQAQATLPTLIFGTYQSPENNSVDRAWAAALLLIIIIMLLNLTARAIAWWRSPNTRQSRR